MNQLTEAQVSAAFETAGLTPVASPEAITTTLSAQFKATSQAFASVPFDVEPCTFTVLMLKEKN